MQPKTRLEALGIRLSVDGERLLAGRPYGSLTDSDREFIRHHRNELYKSVKKQAETAVKISSILSGLYQQKSASEWEWLRINMPDWWAKRIKLENEVDSHCLDGDPEAAQEPFYQLVEHLRNASIDELSSRIARQLDGADPKRPEIATKAWKPRKLPGPRNPGKEPGSVGGNIITYHQ